jgi:ribonucleoside-diphosphate reductase subunit M1
MKNRIIADGGSVQNIPNIPADIKALYKTVWELSQRTILQMAADRGAYIDQSQSLNIHMKEPTMGKITSMHFAGWKMGLKTGMYYLRTMAASAPIQFTVDQEQLKVADTNVARTNGNSRKRAPGSPASFSNTYSSVPRPMYEQKPQNLPVSAVNGTSEPLQPISSSRANGVSRREASVSLSNGSEVDEQADGKKTSSEEDSTGTNEQDIYAQKVLQCSIENKEECVMCSG